MSAKNASSAARSRAVLRWLFVATLLGACGDRTPQRADGAETALGGLHLPLITSQQQSFRLRDARFEIARRDHTLVIALDSERDPDALSLDAELPQGAYEITLHDGWRLEQRGSSDTVSAALLTADPLEFEVQNARVTELSYRFTSERGVLTLGAGSVSVSIAVTPPNSAPCDLLDGASCPAGQTCRLANEAGQTFCATAGSLFAGSPCSSENCEAGTQCLKLDDPSAEQGVCARFCDPALPRPGCQCQGLSFAGVGVCVPSPPAETGASAIDFDPEVAAGQPLSLGDDQVSAPLPIGFDFTFFGRRFSTVQVSSNGFLILGSTAVSDGCCSGRQLPFPDGIDNIVAFAWTDWFPPGGRVSFETRGVAPRRRFLLDFVIVPEFGGGGALTTQVKLFEGSNFIEVHTESQVVNGHIVTQGVENADGTRAFFLPGRVAAQFQLARDAVRFRTDLGVPPVVCGDGRQEGDEQCDDGNRLAGDGCDPSCVIEPGCAVTIERELMITDLSVVDDAMRTGRSDPNDARAGAWSFGHLMLALAPSDAAAPALVEAMFRTWQTPQLVNGFQVPARSAIAPLLLDSWPRLPGGQLDLDRSPLTLNAIVNRIDLRDLNDGHAGEGRFIFAVNSPGSPFPQQFTVILEYRLPALSRSDVAAWAAAWHQLGSLPFPSESYNAALQAITDRFSGRGADPTRVNGSALRHVRSNEIALQSPWELRQFELGANGQLVPSPVSLTPADSLNFSATLGAFVNENEAAILAERHTVPPIFLGAGFQGGSSFNDLIAWQSTSILNNEARHKFSLNTCSGCHGGETGIAFLQVSPRSPGSAAGLSGFLTGTSVSDPVTGQPRSFNDLARRQTDLSGLLCPPAAASGALGAPAPADIELGIGRVH